MADPAADRPADHGELLVVDDEPFLRDAVAASLTFLGFQVSTADTGTEALRLARERPFDLAVLVGRCCCRFSHDASLPSRHTSMGTLGPAVTCV